MSRCAPQPGGDPPAGVLFTEQPDSGFQDHFRLSLTPRADAKGVKRVPTLRYVQIGLFYVLAMLSSNYALKHVNYPTQVIAKSCKMVPGAAVPGQVGGSSHAAVMLAGLFWQRKKFTKTEMARVVLVTAGVVSFLYFKVCPAADLLRGLTPAAVVACPVADH